MTAMRKHSLALDGRIEERLRQQAETLIGSAGFAGERISAGGRAVKRLVDVAVAILVIALGFPFFLAIALLIKLTSKGPVFFIQERIGENGRTFSLYKFRTMRCDIGDLMHREFTRNFILGSDLKYDLDEEGLSVYKITNDSRVTAVGSFLRKTSLDELPQFLNILKGEMTIVGPRPPLKYEYEYYEDWHKLRLKVRPGLTGLWQVSGRSCVTFNEMVMLDLYYIQNWSLLLDFRIMLRTVPVMLAGTGGY